MQRHFHFDRMGLPFNKQMRETNVRRRAGQLKSNSEWTNDVEYSPVFYQREWTLVSWGRGISPQTEPPSLAFDTRCRGTRKVFTGQRFNVWSGSSCSGGGRSRGVGAGPRRAPEGPDPAGRRVSVGSASDSAQFSTSAWLRESVCRGQTVELTQWPRSTGTGTSDRSTETLTGGLCYSLSLPAGTHCAGSRQQVQRLWKRRGSSDRERRPSSRSKSSSILGSPEEPLHSTFACRVAVLWVW